MMSSIDLEGRKILCLVEGVAEETIVNILLNNDLLIFDRENLLYKKPLRRESVSRIEEKYLGLDFGDTPLVILRVIDSRRERFKLSKLYRHKVEEIYTALTPPEIEILIILLDDCYESYCRSGQKPSTYCKIQYRRNIKKADFISEKFRNPEELVSAIERHKSMIGREIITLADFLK